MTNRIDCTKTENFLKELERMCANKRCDICQMRIIGGCSFDAMKKHIQGTIEIVQEWSDEHPVKTRLDDLLEKYPNIKRDSIGFPVVCARSLGYCEECEEQYCETCWNTPLDDNA